MRPAILLLCVPLLGSASPSKPVQAKEVANKVQVKHVYMPEKYRKYVEYECKDHNVPTWIVANLIERESKWNSRAVGFNKDGTQDFGLMQLNSAYIEEFSWRYRRGLPFDPLKWSDNVAIGVEHLAILYKNTKSWNGALVSYNAGLTRYLRGKAPKVSLLYAQQILDR